MELGGEARVVGQGPGGKPWRVAVERPLAERPEMQAAISLSNATVAAADAMTADAWDTALLVLGPERGYDCAVEHGIAALLISRTGDTFVTQETPAWRKRFATATSSSPAGRQTRSP